MSWANVFLGIVCLSVGWLARSMVLRRRAKVVRALNVIGNTVLPLPDDPRWEMRNGRLVLDDVRVWPSEMLPDVEVSGVRLHGDKPEKYAMAVVRAHVARRSV